MSLEIPGTRHLSTQQVTEVIPFRIGARVAAVIDLGFSVSGFVIYFCIIVSYASRSLDKKFIITSGELTDIEATEFFRFAAQIGFILSIVLWFVQIVVSSCLFAATYKTSVI